MQEKPENLVTLNNVGIHRSNRWLVRGVSFSIETGEIVTLIGPNGVGQIDNSKIGAWYFQAR